MRDLLRAGTLLLIALVVFGTLMRVPPFIGDNVKLLAWADATPVTGVFATDPAAYPEWRPVTYAAFWLQYQITGVRHLTINHAVNLALWFGCAWLLYRVTAQLVDGSIAALLAGAILLTDPRAIMPLLGFERATIVACLFGLSALLIVVNEEEPPMGTPRWLALSLLLLGAALSKEYGLAFGAGVMAASVWQRRAPTAAAAAVAAAAYLGLRFGFAGGATATFCEESGYFFTVHNVCFDGVHSVLTAQVPYNVAAAGISTLVRGLFDNVGEIAPGRRAIAVSSVWLALALAAWWKGKPPVMRTMIPIIACNALLNFMLFRSRNQVVGLCAMAISAGVGAALVHRRVTSLPRARVWQALLAAACVAALAVQAVTTRQDMQRQAQLQQPETPCQALAGYPPVDRSFVLMINDAYGIDDDACAPRATATDSRTFLSTGG